MKSIVLCVIILLVATNGPAEMRTWTAQNGKTFVGELVSGDDETAMLKGENGKIIIVPIAGLSQEDRDYIVFMRPVDLSIAVEQAETEPFLENVRTLENVRALEITVRNKKRQEVGKPLDVYYFVLDLDDKVLLSGCHRNLRIDDSELVLSDVHKPSAHYNTEDYDEYLVLAADSAGNIVASESSSRKLNEDAERQRQLFLLEKGHSCLPALLNNRAASPSESMDFRFIDFNFTIRTNEAGKVINSYRHEGFGPNRTYAPYEKMVEKVDSLVQSGFNTAELAPNFKYTRHLSTLTFPYASLPQIPALLLFAPGEGEDLYWREYDRDASRYPQSWRPPPMWFTQSHGRISYGSDITFRFVSQGNSPVFVGLDGEAVLTNRMMDLQKKDADEPALVLPLSEENSRVCAGDWITMKKGEAKTLDIFMIPVRKGPISNLLFIEVRGESYPENEGGASVLPLFCAGLPPSPELIDSLYAEACPPGAEPPEPVVFKIVQTDK